MLVTDHFTPYKLFTRDSLSQLYCFFHGKYSDDRHYLVQTFRIPNKEFHQINETALLEDVQKHQQAKRIVHLSRW